MPYTDFQLIAYEVPTVVGVSLADIVSGWDPGDECPPVARIPLSADVTGDARIRLARFAAVVYRAATQIAAGPDVATTLKVFVAPEFYFRPPGTKDAGDPRRYSTYSVSDRAQILSALNEMFVHADFAGWLFVCGTVMWNTLADEQRNGDALYYNTAVVVRGGEANALEVVEKHLPSDIDGVPVMDSDVTLLAGPANDTLLKGFFERWFVRRSRLLVVGGRTIGLEICLDHANADPCRVLKRLLGDWSFWESLPEPGIDLHLLVAGSMALQAESIVARVGGYVVRNDGIAPTGGSASEAYEVTGYVDAGGDAGEPKDPGAKPDVNPVAVTARDVFPAGTPLQLPAAPSTHGMFAQALAYYPVSRLP